MSSSHGYLRPVTTDEILILGPVTRRLYSGSITAFPQAQQNDIQVVRMARNLVEHSSAWVMQHWRRRRHDWRVRYHLWSRRIRALRALVYNLEGRGDESRQIRREMRRGQFLLRCLQSIRDRGYDHVSNEYPIYWLMTPILARINATWRFASS